MTEAAVYLNEKLAGALTKTNNEEYTFSYDLPYFNDPSAPSISLTLPKTRRDHQANELFPFFAGLLAEGDNRRWQQETLNIDPKDDFLLLIRTAGTDTIGAITVREW
ncbi:HipA N-terminal domain-containing protein [Chitinophaga horti]|uniref:HipA N-terminal domain-containing protein n=1 Tax=Chitinophaga horti TaxID=2920382 RepID=A0ABY6IYC1_9BACT|nr:HipA N-terminal domain-containing protein [Chitinophaga horti]UYQ92389.1 HipA N-terminal domain-containing protein [Chitinophaga horti]